MIKRMTSIVLIALVILIWALPHQAGSDERVPYPRDYRKWVHVGTALVGPQSPFFATGGGIHHIYANDKAMKGYEAGKFPDGAILVFDLLDTKEINGTTIEGPRQRIDVIDRKSTRLNSSH